MAKKVLVNYDFNKNEIQNVLMQKIAGVHASPVEGIFWYDSVAKAPYFHNGTASFCLDPMKATGIPLANLATDPLARANHTGTQLASTISDFMAQVVTARLDQMAAATAAVSLNNQKLTNLAAPAAGSNDAARIVDVENAVASAASGIDSKVSVRGIKVVTTLAAAQTGLSAIDGVTPVDGDRWLVVDSTFAANTYAGVFIAHSGTWTRALDADGAGEITPGAFWMVEEGTTWKGSQWRCATTGAITPGTTAIQITQFGASSAYSNGNGMDLTGSVFSVKPVASGNITVTASGVDVDTSKVVLKKAFTFGDGSLTSITLTHSLNTLDVTTQVRDASTNAVVDCDITNATVNTIVLGFAVAPALNSLRAVIHG